MTLTTRLARLALIAGIGLLGACKPASEAPRATVVNPDASASQPADYRESSPGKPGGTLRLSTSSDTTTLDLHSISHGNTQWLGRILFDCLVYQDEQGNNRSSRYVRLSAAGPDWSKRPSGQPAPAVAEESEASESTPAPSQPERVETKAEENPL